MSKQVPNIPKPIQLPPNPTDPGKRGYVPPPPPKEKPTSPSGGGNKK
jgi:hypothetical protein